MSGPDKTAQLEDAVEQSIAPGMTIHLTTQSRAATRAIQRVFRGRRLGLTLVMCRVGGGNAADLVASGLVRRVIAGSYGAVSSQYTGRYPQIGRAYRSGEVEFEHWTFLSLTQRLMAAAQDEPFAITHSLGGSTMAATNSADFRQVRDPLGTGRDVNVISAIRPDVSFVHASAADADGNSVMLPPLEDGVWGALASRDGAVVTTEQVVSADAIRAHSHLVRVPAMRVRFVCEAPFGAHPGPFGSTAFPGYRQYVEDSDALRVYFAAVRSPEPSALHSWVDEWILEVDHQQYLAKLGEPRLQQLQNPPQADDATSEATAPAGAVTNDEILMTLAYRAVVAKVRDHHRSVLLVGVGLSEVPAVAAFEQLRGERGDLVLAMGHGFFGIEPAPGRSGPDPATTLMTTDTIGIYGTLLASPERPGLAILGAAQVDRFGNLNSTIVDGRLLTGSGGSNDAASLCETLVVTRLDPTRLVNEVEYVTCAGANVTTVITERATFEKRDGSTLVLTSYVVREGESPGEALEQVRRGCGWTLDVAADATAVTPPTSDELTLIRRHMPVRYRSGSPSPVHT